MSADFLFELGTEELPAKSLKYLSEALKTQISTALEDEVHLAYKSIHAYATPRRLAILIRQLQAQQADRKVMRRGPAVLAAFDQSGAPTMACISFAKSCNVPVDALARLETDKGVWVVCEQDKPGEKTRDLMPHLIEQALKRLPIGKMMRWGDTDFEFARPVKWLVMCYGKDQVKASLFGCESGTVSYGHRFHHPDEIAITHPGDYAKLLCEKGKVIVDFDERRAQISTQIQAVSRHVGYALIDEDLLDEVTGIVEWPVAMLADFDPAFLKVPKEAIISALQSHQKCFGVVDAKGALLPHFVLVSNIESLERAQVIQGNEKVVRARLSDAAFFFAQDKKQSLESRVEQLKKMLYQEKLGSLFDKVTRIQGIAEAIARQFGLDLPRLAQASCLAKADLSTALVGEFPELQGIAGYYYALHDGQPNDVAEAIREHYQPRHASDTLPNTEMGRIIALADRLDTLMSLFSVGLKPTGDKDPYGCRRAALGIIKICVEHQLHLDLRLLTQEVATSEEVLTFIFERLHQRTLEKSPEASDMVKAVLAISLSDIYDAFLRLEALSRFKRLPEAAALVSAHKRVNQLLKKQGKQDLQSVDPNLFTSAAEKNLCAALEEVQKNLRAVLDSRAYVEALEQLATLKGPIDYFFECVMVMDPDTQLRNNRLSLLAKLADTFLSVADLGELSI